MGISATETSRRKQSDGGATLSDLTVSFYAKATPDKWRALAERVQMQLYRDPQGDRDFSASFAALPERISRDSLYLTGDIHPVPDTDDSKAHWHLHWRTVPSTTPPKSLLKLSKKVCGYPQVLSTIADNWPGELNIDIEATATYIINREVLSKLPARIRYRPKAHEFKIGRKRHVLQPALRMTMWDVVPPIGGLTSVSIIRTDKTASLVADASVRVTLSNNMQQLIDDAVWDDVMRFMEAA